MARLDLDAFANSRLGLRVAAGLGRAAPPALGTRLASTAARIMAADPERAMVQAVRSNQWVVSGGTLLGEALDEQARATLKQMARSVYDLYHLGDQPERLKTAVRFTDAAIDWLDRSMHGDPVMLAAPHLSNFDLVGKALTQRGVRAQVLSVPDPTDAYQAQNAARREEGLDVTPISLGAIRSAEERLREGGLVITGIDRPAPGVKRRPVFFGRETELPIVHIRLAMRTGAHLVAFLVRLRDDGVYELDCQQVELQTAGDDAATLANACAVLRVAERAIKAHPEQWAMPHPVWPEAIAELEVAENATLGADKETT